MSPEQAGRISTAFARETARSPRAGLGDACADVLTVTGVGITVMIGGQIGPICVSNGNVAALEDIQFALGQGPCQDAYEIERPVLTPRLDEQAARRWPAFVDLANSSGISAALAYPLIALGTKLGVTTMYQNVEGDLLDAQHSDAWRSQRR